VAKEKTKESDEPNEFQRFAALAKRVVNAPRSCLDKKCGALEGRTQHPEGPKSAGGTRRAP